VVIDFVKKLRRNPAELEILGDGSQKKSYLHVKDLVNAFFVVLNGFHERNEIVEAYNVGSSDQVDVLRIAEIVCEEMRIAKPRFRFNSAVEGGRGWKGDVKTMQLSIKKLLDLGWKPVYRSEDAIRLSCRELLDSSRKV
jgi:UDP-glucose 4-epimerase